MTIENTMIGISVYLILLQNLLQNLFYLFPFTARVNQFCCSPEAAEDKSLSLFKVSAMSSTFSFLSTSTIALFSRQ